MMSKLKTNKIQTKGLCTESIFILCQIMTIQGHTIHANELSLFEAWAMEMSTLSCEVWNLIEETDRHKETEPQGPKISLQQIWKTARKGVAANYFMLLCETHVCVSVCEGLAVNSRCQTSQPHPRYGTTCWNEAIWRLGYLSGVIL